MAQPVVERPALPAEINALVQQLQNVFQQYGFRLNMTVTTSGETGGSSSAGAGNQYVEMEVNGVVYKVLHDGTV